MNFKGLAIQTDVLCASGTTTAYFPPDALVSCTAVLSPTEPETLSFAIPRTDARLSEVVVGRVVRTRFTDSTDDVEWDIVAIDDSSRSNVVQVTALPILMRLARCIVNTTSLSDGSVTFDYTGVDLQASEWLDELIFPATTAAGLTWITAGTIDSTRRFGIAGEWSSALEVLAAIAAPGSASCEYRLRRNGTTGYYLDLVTQIGSSAATVRVRPQVNLLETARQRNAVDIATRLYPRGSTSSVSTRTMANHIWQVDSVVSGTVLQLRDVNSGVGPIAYDDQLNGLWLAPMNSTTFSSQEVTDSVASNQRVTISNTTGIVAGDWVRFFHEAGSTAQRVTSVTHPTLVKPPTQGGIGDRGQILDRPNIVADTNLAKNPTMVNWTVSADPPNTWSEYAATPANVSFDKESTDVVIHGTNTWRIRTTGTSSGARGEPLIIPPDGVFSGALVLTQQPGVRVETGDISVWKLATARHTATVWLKVADCPPPVGYDNARVYMYLRDVSRPDFATKPIHPSLQAGLIGTWDYDEGSERGTWLRFQSAPFDLSTFVDFGVSTLNQYHNDIDKVNGKVRVCIELAGGNTGSSTITDKYLYPNYLGAWSSVATYSTNDVVLHVVSGVTRYFIALTTSNNKQPENHLGTNWAEVDGGTNTQQYAGQNVASGWDVYVGPVTVAESTEPIGDREYSGGTELWQSANAALPSRSAVARGYDLRVADLARDDGTTYGDYEFVPGGTIEVINPELDNDVASLRLVEYRPNYLQPLQSEVRVGLPPERLTDLTGQYTDAGTTAAPTTTGAGTVVSGGGTFSLPDTGVVPGTYGSATQTPQIIVDAKGRLTSATNVTIVAGTAAALTPGATINGQLFTGASNITITAGTPQALTAGNYLVSGGTFDGTNPRTFDVDATDANTASKVVARDASGNFAAGTITAALQGNAATATALQTARNINGVSFNGTADITVTAAAGTLTGNTLASGVTASSLTSVGTIGTGIWQGTSVGKNYGGTGLTSSAFTGVTNERVFAYDGGSGTFFVAPSGSNGQALIYSGGALAWGNPAPGSHVLADTTGLGAEHTVSGLTSGMILQATGATTARFQTPSIPASSVTAGTFSGVSYTITNDLTVSGTLTGSLTGNASTATTLQTARNINGVSFNGSADITVTAAAGTLTGNTLAAGVTASSLTSVGTLTDLTVTNPISGSITGNAATVTNGVYTTGSYADPSWITSLAGSKITGNISGSAANVTGTVAIGNGGTGTTNYFVSGSGTRAIVYDVVSNAFEAVVAGTAGQFLQSAGSTGDIVWATPPNFTSSAAGYAPASGGGTSNFLRADGTWAVPAVGSVSANNVTAGTFSGANYFFTNNVRFDSGARVAFGYGYTIDNAGGTPLSVLTATTLGSGVINSSLTSVGTLTSGALGAGFTAIDNARLANSSITINGSSVSLGGSITVSNQTITLSGDATGSGTTSIPVTLADTTVVAGTYGGNNAIPRLTVDSKGRLTGVSTITPSGTWSINITGSAATATDSTKLPLTGGTLTGNLQIGEVQNLQIAFRTASAWYYYLKGVSDDFFIQDAQATNYLSLYYNGGGTGKYASILGALNVINSGDVGIGTTSPQAALDISRATNAPQLQITGNANATQTTGIGIVTGSTRRGFMGWRGTSSSGFAATGMYFINYDNSPIIFATTATEAGRFSLEGNLSVGTTTQYAGTNVRSISIGAPAYPALAFYANDVFQANIIVAGADVVFGAIANKNITFEPGGSEKLRFTNDGKVLIGTTTDPTTGGFTNTRVLIKQIADGLVGGGLHIEQSSNTNVAYFGFTGSSFRIGTSYRSTGSYQPIDFWTGPTSASSMILNTSGNLGIGTASPRAKLEVNGDIFTTWGTDSFIGMVFQTGSEYRNGIKFNSSARSTGLVARYGDGTGYVWLGAGPNEDERVRVTAAGNVGIGTTNPESSRLLVRGSTSDSTSDILQASASSGATRFIVRADGRVIFYGSDNGEKVRITESGNVGIGTTSPVAPLEVKGGAVMTGGWNRTAVLQGTFPVLVFHSSYTPKYAGIAYDSTTAMRFYVNASGTDVTAASPVLNITNSGNVGIGETSPNALLVAKASGNYGTIACDNSTTTGGGAFAVRKQGSAIGYLLNKGSWYGDTTNDLCLSAESGYNVRIYTNGSASEKFIFTAGGSLGIGTTSPSEMLHVAGNVYIGNGNYRIRFRSGSSWDYYLASSSDDFFIYDSNSFNFFEARYNGGGANKYALIAGAMQVYNAGNVLINGSGWAGSRFQVTSSSNSAPTAEFNGTSNSAGLPPVYIWNNAESGNTYFIAFYTDGQNNPRALRGDIRYRRATNDMALASVSDYRIKTIHGPYTKSGEVFDKIQIHDGTMRDATMGHIPMAVAHELAEAVPYAVDGEKDAVNDDGTPKLQMVDYACMIPLMLAEIKSLRARVAALES